MSFYDTIHSIYHGTGKPINGPVQTTDAPNPSLVDGFWERKDNERKELEKENDKIRMKEFERRRQQGEFVHAVQNAAIAVGALCFAYGD
jgi:hypothetical protein